MTGRAEVAHDNPIDLLVAERAITRVLTSYSRGVDRCDFDAVRACFWDDGTDHHGSFVGNVDDFIPFLRTALARFERTAHFLGNIHIDVDLRNDVAEAETYVVAFHRFADAEDGLPTDMWAGLRYADRFERRQGEWRIRERVCAFEWRRTDRVDPAGARFADTYVRGLRSTDDAVYHIRDSWSGNTMTPA